MPPYSSPHRKFDRLLGEIIGFFIEYNQLLERTFKPIDYCGSKKARTLVGVGRTEFEAGEAFRGANGRRLSLSRQRARTGMTTGTGPEGRSPARMSVQSRPDRT